jgi:hypothetical protein
MSENSQPRTQQETENELDLPELDAVTGGTGIVGPSDNPELAGGSKSRS